MTEKYDVIVLGAGVMGSATAYHLAAEGRSVLLLEQFEIGHSRGASHGESRIFRYAYPNLEYAKFAMQSKELWRAFERETGELLLWDTGGLDIGDGAGLEVVRETGGALRAAGAAYEELDHRLLGQRFPQWRLPEDARAVYSPDAGVLFAGQVVRAFVNFAAKHGARVRSRERVLGITQDGSSVEVATDKGRYYGQRLVITSGAWTNDMLRHLGIELPLKVSQEQIAYFQPRDNFRSFVSGGFPIWLHHRDKQFIYGFPILGKPAVKLAFHHDGLFINLHEYAERPRGEVVARLRWYLEEFLPDAAGEMLETSTCLYTATPDHDFVIDTLPGMPHIAVGAGFSGHGFKFAIGVGRALADLVVTGHTEICVAHLGIKRFLKGAGNELSGSG